jgi:hypothetical protein
MKRELANKMYNPTNYYLGRFLSNLLLQLCYPLCMTSILFFGIGIERTFETYFKLMGFSMLGNMVFCA